MSQYESQKIRIAIPEIGQNMRNYVGAVRGVGAEPVIISVRGEHIEESYQSEYLDFADFRAENYHAMLLPGGVDMDPKYYGQENKGSVNINAALDTLQMSALDMAVKAKLPILGICRGMQLINVYFGGTLIQDLSNADQHAYNYEKQCDRRNVSLTNSGSWLHTLYGNRFAHNSAHHQAVDVPGRGIIIDSRCENDGVVEAYHHESLPIIAVQWHPERMCFANARTDTEDGSRVFRYFLTMCEQQRSMPSMEEGAML